MMRGVLGRAGAQASASANDASDGVESSSSEGEKPFQQGGQRPLTDFLQKRSANSRGGGNERLTS